MSLQAFQRIVAHTKQGLYLPLARLSPHVVVTLSPAVIQDPEEKCSDVIYLVMWTSQPQAAAVVFHALHCAQNMMRRKKNKDSRSR